MKLSQTYAPSTMTVCIIGGGIGGLATALALQRHGINALVFERTQQFREVGSGLILAGNAVKALQKLGLADALHTIAAPLRYSLLRSWQGDVLVNVPMQEAMQRCGASMVGVHRAELHTALVQALEQRSVHTKMQAIGFEQDEEGVQVRFASGEEVWADMLVGADGLHSVDEARRIKRANAMVQRSRLQGRIAQWEYPWGVRLRDFLLRMTPRRLLVKQIEWIVDNQIGEPPPYTSCFIF